MPEGTRKVQTTTSGTPTDRTETSSFTVSTTTKRPTYSTRPATTSTTGYHIPKNITEEELGILKQEHRQYVDHKFNDNLNTLAEEVKKSILPRLGDLKISNTSPCAVERPLSHKSFRPRPMRENRK